MVISIQDIRGINWQPKLNAFGEVVEGTEEIDQCIRIILTTQKGSVPHRPEFGSDLWKYLDYPVDLAVPNMVREIIDSIQIWETRIKIISVQPVIENEHVNITIKWNYKDSNNENTTEVNI